MFYYGSMKIIVGLGNPGKEYENTRHNTGRIMVGMIEKKLSQESSKLKIKFVTPDTFMNKSGPAVAKALTGEKVFKDLIVVYDDIDLPLGKIKISFNRSSGGHNGLESIIKALRSEKFLRIRIGISPAKKSAPQGGLAVARKPKGEKALLNFLLGEFKKTELETVKKLGKVVTEAVKMIYAEGPGKAMSLFNN